MEEIIQPTAAGDWLGFHRADVGLAGDECVLKKGRAGDQWRQIETAQQQPVMGSSRVRLPADGLFEIG